MKKVLVGLVIIIAGILAVQSSALAVPFTDYLTVPHIYLNRGDSRSYTFNLDTDLFSVGDINPEDTVNWAYLDVIFEDDYAPFGDCSDWSYQYEYARIMVDGSVKGYREIDYGSYSFYIRSEVSDHIANVNILCYQGDFYLNGVQIRGDYTDNPSASPVPEPMTMLLFGPALLGLVGFKRRKHKLFFFG